MKLPAAVPINNYAYKILTEKGLADRTGAQGTLNPIARVITLDADLLRDKRELERTLVHELLHGHQIESGVCEILDHQAQELVVESLAGFLTSIFDLKFKKELF